MTGKMIQNAGSKLLLLSLKRLPSGLLKQLSSDFDVVQAKKTDGLDLTRFFSICVSEESLSPHLSESSIPLFVFYRDQYPSLETLSAFLVMGVFPLKCAPYSVIKNNLALLSPKPGPVYSEEWLTTLKELQEMDRLKTEFLSNISHELQSPLTPLEGYIELFLSHDLGEVTEEQKGVLEIMLGCTLRLKNQISNLLLLGGMGVNQLEIDIDEFYFHDFLLNLKRIFSFQLQQKKLTLDFDITARHAYVKADIQQISKVMVLLLDNAIKFSNDDSIISIKTLNISSQALKQKLIDTSDNIYMVCLSYLPTLLDPSQIYLEVTLEDQGVGIPQEKLKQIFNVFYQVDGSSTRSHGGVGVGLSIAKKILEKHESLLCIHSLENKGTSVSFVLPIVSYRS